MSVPISPDLDLVSLADALTDLRYRIEAYQHIPGDDSTPLTAPHLAPGSAPLPEAAPDTSTVAYDPAWQPDPLPLPDDTGPVPAGHPAAADDDLVRAQVSAAVADVQAQAARDDWAALTDELDELAPAADLADRALAVSLADHALPRARDRAAAAAEASAVRRDVVSYCRDRYEASVANASDGPAPPRLPRPADSRRDRVVDALTVTGPVLTTAQLLDVVAAYQGHRLAGSQISWLKRDDAHRPLPRIAAALDADGTPLAGTWTLEQPRNFFARDTRQHHGAGARANTRALARSLAFDAFDTDSSDVCDPELLRELAVRQVADQTGSDPPEGREAATRWLAAATNHLARDPWPPGGEDSSV